MGLDQLLNVPSDSIEYQGKSYKVGQWTVGAMAAVEAHCKSRARDAILEAPLTPQMKASALAEYAKTVSSGAYGFWNLTQDGSLFDFDNMAVFLQKLVEPNCSGFTVAMARELCENAGEEVGRVVKNANPQLRETTKKPEGTTPQSTTGNNADSSPS